MRQFSLQPLKYKIVIAFLCGCIALCSTYFISNYVFRETFGTLYTFSDLDPKLLLTERLFPEINRLDKAQRLEAFRSPIQSATNFKNSSRKILFMLDSLEILCYNDTVELDRILQMRTLLSQRNSTFLNYLQVYRKLIKNTILSGDLKKISEDLSLTLKKSDSGFVRSTTKTITTTSVTNVGKRKVKVEKKSFFKRLFSRKKDIVEEPRPVESKIITQNIVVRTDTYDLVRNPGSAEDLDQTLTSIEAKQRVRGSKLLQEEIKLATANARFIDQLQALLRQIQNEEIRDIRQKSGSLKSIFQEAYSRVGIIVFIFIVLTLLLIALMFADISKSDKYKVQLVLEKEKAQQSEQVKQRFLSNMSHELRTPLQAILGFSEQLENRKFPQKKSLNAIKVSSKYLLQLVNEVLDYNRIVSDKFTLSKEEFDLSDILGEICDVIETQCEKKKLDFIFNCQVKLKPLFFGDPFRLKQILYNLLSNAVKFTESGMVSLRVDALPSEDNNVSLMFDISDTGIGMTKEEIGRIFNYFEQANPKVLTKYGGSGLGLSIVKALVELHGGSLSVESELGKGSLFKICLTYELMGLSRQKPEYTENFTNNRFYKHVLVIDDDAFVTELSSAILKKNNIYHSCGCSLDDILQKAKNPAIDLVLIDMRMPEVNGRKVLQLLKKKMASHVRYIAMTAYSFSDETNSIMQAGFDGILLKPFAEKDLLGILVRSGITEYKRRPFENDCAEKLMCMTNEYTIINDNTFEVFSEQIIIDLEKLERGLCESDLKSISFHCHRLFSKLAQIGLNSIAQRIQTTDYNIRERNFCDLTLNEYLTLKDNVLSSLDKLKTPYLH